MPQTTCATTRDRAAGTLMLSGALALAARSQGFSALSLGLLLK